MQDLQKKKKTNTEQDVINTVKLQATYINIHLFTLLTHNFHKSKVMLQTLQVNCLSPENDISDYHFHLIDPFFSNLSSISSCLALSFFTDIFNLIISTSSKTRRAVKLQKYY